MKIVLLQAGRWGTLVLLCACGWGLPGCSGDEGTSAPSQTATGSDEEHNKGGTADNGSDANNNADAAGGHMDDAVKLPIDLTQTSFMAADLVDAYDLDSAATLQALGGRKLQISGVVDDVGHELDRETADGELQELGAPFIKLVSGLTCVPRDEKPWGTVWPQQLVIVTGTLASDSLVLQDCEVRLVGESVILPMSAEDLAAEFAFNAELATAAYTGQALQVTGIVQLVGYNDEGAARVTLLGDGDVRIGCIFSAFEWHRLAKLAAGDELTVTADFLRYNAEAGVVEITYCLPLRIAK